MTSDTPVATSTPNWARPVRSTAATTVGLVRVGVGLLLAAAPGAFVRRFVDDGASGSLILGMRTVGIRDLALGLGTLAADRSGTTAELDRWVRVGLISDALDLATGLAGSRLIGRRGAAIATMTVRPVLALDGLGLRRLAATVDPPASD
jgi:hypothetical protein